MGLEEDESRSVLWENKHLYSNKKKERKKKFSLIADTESRDENGCVCK